MEALGDVDVGILEALADEEHGGLCAVARDVDLPGHPGGGGQIVGSEGLVVLVVVNDYHYHYHVYIVKLPPSLTFCKTISQFVL